MHRLQEMERLGFIRRLFTQTRTSSEGEYIDFVMVQGGLIAEGEALLHQQANGASDKVEQLSNSS